MTRWTYPPRPRERRVVPMGVCRCCIGEYPCEEARYRESRACGDGLDWWVVPLDCIGTAVDCDCKRVYHGQAYEADRAFVYVRRRFYYCPSCEHVDGGKGVYWRANAKGRAAYDAHFLSEEHSRSMFSDTAFRRLRIADWWYGHPPEEIAEKDAELEEFVQATRMAAEAL